MASSQQILFVILISFNLYTNVITYKESYIIYFREGRNKVPVTIEMDLREKVAFLNTINEESQRSQTVSLSDYSTNMIAFKDSEKNACYLEKMKDSSFVYERRLLKSLTNQVLLEQPDLLYVEEPPLTRKQVLNIAGSKILNFCRRTLKYLVYDSPPHEKRRSKRSTRPRAGNVQKTYSHHEHRSENYARFGHETTAHNHPQGSSKVTFIDPHHLLFNYSQPSAFELAAIRHLKRRNRDKNLRIFNDKPVGGSFYGSSISNAGQINTKIDSGFPDHSGFQANGQFSLTNVGGFEHGQDRANGNAGTFSSNFPSHSIPLSQPNQYLNGQHYLGQTHFPVLTKHTSGQQFVQVPGSQGFVHKPNTGANGLSHPIDNSQRTVDTGLSSQSRVELEKDKFHAGASSQGALGSDSSKTQVQGSASKDGTFQAQAQSSSTYGSSRSLIEGSEAGAKSSSLSELQNVGLSQTHTELAYDRSKAEATALTSSQMGSISSQSHGDKQGGQASSVAKGPGETSSSARVGFNEAEASQPEPFFGKAEASAQGGINDGQSRTQVSGEHKGSIYSAVASGSYGQPNGHQGPIAMALPGNADQTYLSQHSIANSQNPSFGQIQTRENIQPAHPSFHSSQFLPENQHQLPSNIFQHSQIVPGKQILTDLGSRQSSAPSSAHQVPPIYYPGIHNSPSVSFKSQYVPQVLPPKIVQQSENQKQPMHYFPGIKVSNEDKQVTLQPHPFLNKQKSELHLPQDKKPLFQPLYSPPLVSPKIPASTNNLLPNGGLQKSASHIPSQTFPATNGFRTTVVTSYVQPKGSFFPTPAIDVSKYHHQGHAAVFHNQQNGYHKQGHLVNSYQNQQIQNRNLLTKTLPSSQLPANSHLNSEFPLKKSDQTSKCTSSCFHGYKIVKTVKICKVVLAC